MSLRLKTLLILFFSLLVVLSAFYVGMSRYVFGEFMSIEQIYFDRVGEQIKRSLKSEEKQLSSFVRDWGVWTASYNFIEDLNQNYIDENMTIDALGTIGTACIIYFDSELELRYHYSSPENVALARSVARAVADNHLSIERLDLEKNSSFYLWVENIESPFLVAMHPVLKSDQNQPANGYVLMGVPVDDAFTKRLAQNSGFSFSLRTKDLESCNGNFNNDKIDLALSFLNEETVLMTLKVSDIQKKCSFKLTTEVCREMNVQLQHVFNLILVMMIAIVLLVMLVVVILVNRLVLTPILHHISQFNQICISGDLSHRLTVQGSGELMLLSETANRMIDKIQGLNHEIKQIAETDSLTGLWNRRRFDDQFRCEWLRAQRNRNNLSLLMIDIDHFKSINDTYGHQVGDVCLQKIAKAIADTLLRAADFSARYGGEEFVVILPDIDPPGAMIVAERIRNAVLDLHLENTTNPAGLNSVTVSIGISTIVPTAAECHENMLKVADQAMYRAKQSGRNCSMTNLDEVDDSRG